MRIAVNTRFLLKGKLTGLGHYTMEVLKNLVLAHPEDQFLFLFDRPYHPDFIFASNIEPVVIVPQARTPLLFLIWYEVGVTRILKKMKADVFFSPDNFLSLRSKVPTLLVIHDLAYQHIPESLSTVQLWYYRYFMPRFARKAAHIATVSEATKKDISRSLNIEPSRITVAGLGLNEGIVRHHISEKEDYFIHLGTIQPRKNVLRLLDAFDRYKEVSGKNTKLLFVGSKGWKDAAFYARLRQSKFKQDIHILGYKSNEEISDLLSRSLGLICVSLFEGFGMPVIEAQHCGCPVIASNVSSLPEASGKAAILVDPMKVNEICDAMIKLEKDAALREKLIYQGYENAEKYSWTKTSDIIYSLLRDIFIKH